MRWLALAAVPAALVPVASATSAPTLSLSTQSGVVRGTAFRARELVRLTLTVDGVPTTLRVRATARGRFAAVFRKVTLDACTDWRLVARGSLGSRATLVPRLARECPPPPPP
ncbi:MAG TPA: hypothetical protein VFJ78_00315 [Gaiellaceae bacterium]|nr:hypothetical protein [Gaiellaceae bacterium]